MVDLKDAFDLFEDEYLEFDRIEKKRSTRRDLHAFLLLDKLQPGTRDIISASRHDQFWLDIDCEELAKVIDLEQVCELCRCGIRYHDDVASLSMFS